jgi:hypothetical protein
VDDDVEDFSPSPAGLEDAMDGWELEDHVEMGDVGDEDDEMDLDEAAR